MVTTIDPPVLSYRSAKNNKKLEAQVGQKSLTWIRLIMVCYIVPWWPSWLSDQITFSNPESDVVWRVSGLPPWPPSWILELNDLTILNLHVTLIPPIKFQLNLTYSLEGDVVWSISRWRPSWLLEQNDFSNPESSCCPNASHQDSAQSNLPFGSRWVFEIFKMAPLTAILDIGTEWF